MNFFSTTDINLTSYLILKGFQVRQSRRLNHLIEFVFDKEVETEGESWQFSPTEEMLLIQRFVAEKDKLLNYLKTKQNKQSKGGRNHGQKDRW